MDICRKLSSDYKFSKISRVGKVDQGSIPVSMGCVFYLSEDRIG